MIGDLVLVVFMFRQQAIRMIQGTVVVRAVTMVLNALVRRDVVPKILQVAAAHKQGFPLVVNQAPTVCAAISWMIRTVLILWSAFNQTEAVKRLWANAA